MSLQSVVAIMDAVCGRCAGMIGQCESSIKSLNDGMRFRLCTYVCTGEIPQSLVSMCHVPVCSKVIFSQTFYSTVEFRVFENLYENL